MSDVVSPPRRNKTQLVLVLALVVLLVAAGVGAFLVLQGDDDRNDSYPKEWDERIKPYVEIVEDKRGLSFDHPVKVRFLDAKAFEKTVRADKKDLDKDDRQEIKETTSLFRAFGLISGDVDLFDAFDDARGSGTLAYYSFDDRTITVRGTKLSLATRGTLVHELTHALQDQKFDIATSTKKLAKKASDGKATTEGDALRAIVEGDAERVATLYRASLDKKERAALDKAESADTKGSQEELKGVPKVVTTLIGAPYALGQALTETIAADDDDRVDELLENPPPDDSILLDPLRALDDIDSTKVKIPKPGTGEKKFDSGQVGSLVTYLMLAERIPLRDALEAADTWRGDAYLGFKRKDVLCARVAYAASSQKGAARLTSAFEDWIAAEAGSSATVSSEGKRVTFESCDPGKDAKLGNDASEDAIQLVGTRSYLGVSVIKAGATPKSARCFSNRVINEFSIDDLNDPEFGANDPALVKRVQGLAADCRGQ
ncbi:hypothetical protein [Aeromicrobium sp. NPDC092404]|uniref:hypothetical protein n=1 Tax=Aeromicrobium sp. NPDC092404 TaxID=3154976 RepID=UPI00341DC64B